jgi:hypothetical protein
MFEVDSTGNITMHQGDTGSITVRAARRSGAEWTADDRMLLTVRSAGGNVVMQRIYRLDDAWGLGDGVVLIEFHNDDTDKLETGPYQIERRYDVSPRWESGVAPTGRCVDALLTGDKMIEGNIVRTTFQGTLTIAGVHGDI